MHFTSSFLAAATAGLVIAAPAQRKLKWFGVNLSGAEFGNTNIPGVYNTDYTWYNLSTIDVIILGRPFEN